MTKKPTPRRAAPSIAFTRRSSTLDYVLHFEREAARLGTIVDEILRPFTRELFDDLQQSVKNGFDLAELFDWMGYNLKELLDRRDHRPRIKLDLTITTKDNLSVRWAPLGWGFDGGRDRILGSPWNVKHSGFEPIGETDWHTWDEITNRLFERPSNELLFVHSVGDLVNWIGRRSVFAKYETDDQFQIIEMLLDATERRVRELVEDLERHFIICERDRIVSQHRGDDLKFDERVRLPDEKRRLLSWEIVSDDEWHRRQHERREAEERALLENFASTHGFALETLVEAYIAAEARKKFSEITPNEDARCKRAADGLKARGFKAIPSLVRDTVSLLRRHRPEILPPPPEADQKSASTEGSILEFPTPG